MQHVVMTCGLQASGKSTWAKNEVLRSDGKWKRINRDDLRSMVDAGTWSPQNEKFMLKLRDTLLVTALKQGYNVIIDDTNLTSKHWNDISKLLAKADIDVTLREQWFYVGVDDAIERDSKREKPVGADVIKKTWKQFGKGINELNSPKTQVFFAKQKSSVVQQDQNLPKAIICDLDGTLALIGDRSPYDASRCDVTDKPNIPVIETVSLFFQKGYKILFVSGRDEKDRAPTERFIIQHCKEMSKEFIQNEILRLEKAFEENSNADQVEISLSLLLLENAYKNVEKTNQFAGLFMRSRGDMRADTIIKQEIWDKHISPFYNVLCAIDDRDNVVQMWRHQIGITVFQVADGNF